MHIWMSIVSFCFNLSLFLCSTISGVCGWWQHPAVLVFSVRRFWNNLENVRIIERKVMMIPRAMTDRGPRKLEEKKNPQSGSSITMKDIW